MKWLVFRMFYYSRRSGMCVGFAIVSMVGTNFDDSKLIKRDSAPGPNEIRPRAQMRLGPIGPEPTFIFYAFLFTFLFLFFWFFDFYFFKVFFWPPKGKVLWNHYGLCLYVCNENQLCQFSQFWLLRFFLNLAQWKGASISIEWWRSHADWCIGCPFLGPF